MPLEKMVCHTDAMSEGQPQNPTAKPSRDGILKRALAIIEYIAENGGSDAKAVSAGTGLPLPTTYRLLGELCAEDLLVHLKNEQTYALGYRLHKFGVRLHADLGLSKEIRRELSELHQRLGMATYLAIHRGMDFVIAHVCDSPAAPRLAPMSFGFRENPHASAFGKLGLAALDERSRKQVLTESGMPALTGRTITDLDSLLSELESIERDQIAWEHEEFQEGVSCVAVPFFSTNGVLLGSIATSAPTSAYEGMRTRIEHVLRSAASRVGRMYRLGPHFYRHVYQ